MLIHGSCRNCRKIRIVTPTAFSASRKTLGKPDVPWIGQLVTMDAMNV